MCFSFGTLFENDRYCVVSIYEGISMESMSAMWEKLFLTDSRGSKYSVKDMNL